MEILNQLGGLVLGSVPTMVLFVLLVMAYGLLVRRPMAKILAERHARTTGAVEQAKGAISAAEAETAVYEGKLRAAKSEIYQAREKMLKVWAAEREAVLEEARTATQAKVQAARLEMEQSAAASRKQIESATDALSAQILRAVLPASVAGTGAAQ
jgi:F-type H+-transporting ATPase subunit b